MKKERELYFWKKILKKMYGLPHQSKRQGVVGLASHGLVLEIN